MKNLFKFLMIGMCIFAVSVLADKPIQVLSTSPEVILKLRSNPTTGYSWYLVQYDHDLLTPENHRFIPPTSQLVGASGYEIWRFKVRAQAFVVPQITKITFRYMRPWEIVNEDKPIIFFVVIR